MTKALLLVTMVWAGTLSGGGLAAGAPDSLSQWAALSRTATAITGDIQLDDSKVVFANGVTIGLRLVEDDAGSGTKLYQVTPGANPVLLNGNYLCGPTAVNYVLTQVSGDAPGQRELSFSVYRYPGTLTLADLPLSADAPPDRSLCAIYHYVSAA